MYITFSDSAKFADIARNLVNGLGYGNSFSFWSSNIFEFIKSEVFLSPWTPPVIPLSIAVFFKIFGVTDFAVVATSFFYFILTLIFVYLLARNIFRSNLIGALSTLAVGFNYDLIRYATSGASELSLIFEIVAASYFTSIKKKWANVVIILFLVLMYFTRPQAFIYIAGIILYWLLTNLNIKKALLYFAGVLIVGVLIDRFVLAPLSGKYFLYSIAGRGINAATQIVSGGSASDSLRGSLGGGDGGLTVLTKKVFYNLYNFYKLLPQIINPYLFALFIIGLFRSSSKAVERQVVLQESFKIASVFMVLATFLVTAITIPFFRYIHPVIPLIYIIAIATMIEILNSQFLIFNEFSIFNYKVMKQKFISFISIFIVFFFGMGQTLGVIFLDSRFERQTHNINRPPVYVTLSKILKENTNPDDVVITNLDTWGSWYGERRTIWFPLEPKQLTDSLTGKIPFDAIYLTSYLMDDQNYYMGNSWRQILENPNDTKKWTCDGCGEVAKEYKLMGVYSVDGRDNYEKQNAKAVLLMKK